MAELRAVTIGRLSGSSTVQCGSDPASLFSITPTTIQFGARSWPAQDVSSGWFATGNGQDLRVSFSLPGGESLASYWSTGGTLAEVTYHQLATGLNVSCTPIGVGAWAYSGDAARFLTEISPMPPDWPARAMVCDYPHNGIYHQGESLNVALTNRTLVFQGAVLFPDSRGYPTPIDGVFSSRELGTSIRYASGGSTIDTDFAGTVLGVQWVTIPVKSAVRVDCGSLRP